VAGAGSMDTGTGTAPGTKRAICTRTRGTRIRVPAGYTIPVSITINDSKRVGLEPSSLLCRPCQVHPSLVIVVTVFFVVAVVVLSQSFCCCCCCVVVVAMECQWLKKVDVTCDIEYTESMTNLHIM
jgi:hypothetical protein